MTRNAIRGGLCALHTEPALASTARRQSRGWLRCELCERCNTVHEFAFDVPPQPESVERASLSNRNCRTTRYWQLTRRPSETRRKLISEWKTSIETGRNGFKARCVDNIVTHNLWALQSLRLEECVPCTQTSLCTNCDTNTVRLWTANFTTGNLCAELDKRVQWTWRLR